MNGICILKLVFRHFNLALLQMFNAELNTTQKNRLKVRLKIDLTLDENRFSIKYQTVFFFFNLIKIINQADQQKFTLCKRFMMESLYSELPSIMPVIGFENHSLNSRCDWNTCGIRKCISDHSSIKLFCNGVPVSSRRL